MKVSDLTGEQVEITGAAKRLLAEQAEKEQEMVAIQNGTNEEGAANLERLAEVRQRRAEAAAKRAEETVRPPPPSPTHFPGGTVAQSSADSCGCCAAQAAKEAARAALREERGESWGGVGMGAEPEPEPEPSEGKKKKKKKSKKGKKGDKADRPTIPIPPPKEMKGALIKLQGIASDDFLKRHTLKKASGNKLAKMKRAEFEKILADFQDTADVDELKEFME